LAAGATGGYYYRPAGSDTSSRPSTLGASLIYTQKKQIEIGLGVDLYWKKDAHHFSGGIGYSKFPDTFYGIGNNTAEEMAEDYTPQTFELGLSFQKTVRPGLYLGIHYQFSNTKMLEVEENGLLAKGDIPGSEGGVISSAGLGVNRDTRNNIFYPSSGGFYEFSVSLSRSAIGSDFDFTAYGLDLRKFIPLFSSHVLAFQGAMTVITGAPPFQSLSELGGILRGYAANRYRDKNLIAGQVEYRMPLWWRFGLVGFAGYGDVADKVSHFERNSFKYSAGWGIRYLLIRDEKLNLRFDFGYGQGSAEFYINITEAF
jgi:outer membrane protein assembly factor BamA